MMQQQSLQPYKKDSEDVLYCDPEELRQKEAVHLIMERYDSLKALTQHMAHMQVSEEVEEPPPSPLLSEKEVLQAEVLVRSHKTQVWGCRCAADLYFFRGSGEWLAAGTGVPLLLLDKGETRARNQRRMQIALAERGSGFVLWREVIDNLSSYRASEASPTFHTLCLSSDHRQMAGLSFHVEEAAEEFLRQVEALSSDPRNIALSPPKSKHKKEKKKLPKKSRPKKCEISSPCCFEHVTSVALHDKQLYSLSTLLGQQKPSQEPPG